jgi:dTDP-4-dehydrorhamnose 3,5-epimerase
VHHTDYFVVLEGSISVGLKDLRPGSETWLRSIVVPMTGDKLQALIIPAGVAHGFYFNCPSTFVYGVTDYWSTSDELGCQWDDPKLDIPWPIVSPILSKRDTTLPDFATFQRQVEEGLRAAHNSYEPQLTSVGK